jgi:isocitrate dehydrogenase
MMLRHMGWKEAADLIISSMEKAIASKKGRLRLRAADGRRHAGALLWVLTGDY